MSILRKNEIMERIKLSKKNTEICQYSNEYNIKYNCLVMRLLVHSLINLRWGEVLFFYKDIIICDPDRCILVSLPIENEKLCCVQRN